MSYKTAPQSPLPMRICANTAKLTQCAFICRDSRHNQCARALQSRTPAPAACNSGARNQLLHNQQRRDAQSLLRKLSQVFGGSSRDAYLPYLLARTPTSDSINRCTCCSCLGLPQLRSSHRNREVVHIRFANLSISMVADTLID